MDSANFFSFTKTGNKLIQQRHLPHCESSASQHKRIRTTRTTPLPTHQKEDA